MKKFGLWSLLILPFLASCGLDLGTEGFGYLEADTALRQAAEVNLTYHDFFYQVDVGSRKCLPPTGESHLLVIPVAFEDFPFDQYIVQDLEVVYQAKNNNYPSVSSFYETSSYGQKQLTFEIAPVFDTDLTLKEAFDRAGSKRLSSYLLPLAVNAYEGDLTSFDGDQDGYLDGVVLVYSAPDYQSYDYSSLLSEDEEAELWAYTYNLSGQPANHERPSPFAYSWISSSFIGKGAAGGLSCDPHTFIHEMGHLFGLDDYYSTDRTDPSSSAPANEKYRSPLGMLDTMDYGLLDHNAFSKWSLGWINPYYVEEKTFGGKTSITVEVKDLVNYGEAICLPARGHEYFGNAFGEYLLLELYSPTDLNVYDAGRHYQSGYPNGYSMPGIRLYHVDARMWGKGQAFGNAYYEGNPADINWGHLGVNPLNASYDVAASNTYSQSSPADRRFNLLHLLEADGTYTFQNGEFEEKGYLFGADNSTLFYPDASHGTFDMKRFAAFFVNEDDEGRGLFNDGSAFGYAIRINGIRSLEEGGHEASITISLA